MGTSGYSYNIPSIVVVVGDLSSYFSERDRHVIYIDASLAAMTFMLTLETMGLSSCPINWPDIEKLERKMKKKLSLKSYERPVMLISVAMQMKEVLFHTHVKNENNLIKMNVEIYGAKFINKGAELMLLSCVKKINQELNSSNIVLNCSKYSEWKIYKKFHKRLVY